MFKVTPSPTFTVAVEISQPGAENAVLNIEFKAKTRPQIADFLERGKTITLDEAVKEVVVGWRDVDAAFSPETLQDVLDNYPKAASAIYEAYWREIAGAREKN